MINYILTKAFMNIFILSSSPIPFTYDIMSKTLLFSTNQLDIESYFRLQFNT